MVSPHWEVRIIYSIVSREQRECLEKAEPETELPVIGTGNAGMAMALEARHAGWRVAITDFPTSISKGEDQRMQFLHQNLPDRTGYYGPV